MYDQEEATNRGALQGWTNCFSSSAGGDNVKISKYLNLESISKCRSENIQISKYGGGKIQNPTTSRKGK